MDREILFRGKRIDNGEWVEGCCSLYPDGRVEINRKCDNPPDSDPMWKKILIGYKVDPETVCQFTGLTDKNGRKIFEGDIVKHYYNNYNPEKFDIGVILWDKNKCKFYRTCNGSPDLYGIANYCTYEVIGNIFDNPELLEGGIEQCT